MVETRRILDQFAERRGERTWQTPITQAGLDTLRKLLRRSARKNTAVACHWIRGLDHSELLWIVGDARRFNHEGAVPTNTTKRNILRKDDENDWHNLELIAALAQLAALLHDLGKATVAFQSRLQRPVRERNLYRHEWVSVRLFQAFVGEDKDDSAWLTRLSECMFGEKDWDLQKIGLRDGIDKAASADSLNPFKSLPLLAQAIAWLVVTHHRLPTLWKSGQGAVYHGMRHKDIDANELNAAHLRIDARWNEPHVTTEEGQHAAPGPYWTFAKGLPVVNTEWQKRAARHAKRLLKIVAREPGCDWLADPFVMHISRLCLMLGDHYYSSLRSTDITKPPADVLYANTAKHGWPSPVSRLNQTLDAHLLGVTANTGQVAHALPALAQKLSHLRDNKRLTKRSADFRFRWQDSATDVAASVRQKAAEHGAFIVNMASTGCGKTLANARIMNALADPKRGLRCAFAIGLRTLTLKTGRAFQKCLGLDEESLAILVGGTGSRDLFEFYEEAAEASGSASVQDLLEEGSSLLYAGSATEAPQLPPALASGDIAKLLDAPLLVCTVDHLTPATESLRGGRQIAPMLRLLSGDLVLDEPDDFDIDDLPALTRLVYWAGLLGSRVLLSSATLPPSLVEGLFTAYCEGRKWFQRNRGARPSELINICCLWSDEFSQQQVDCTDAAAFSAAHTGFASQRAKKLSEQPVRRIAELLKLELATHDKTDRRTKLADVFLKNTLRLHADHHSIDPNSGRRVSFGLIRMANIDPLFAVALAMFKAGAPCGFRIHLCPYHSRFPLFLRSAIEQRLDAALDRRDELAVFDLPDIRHRIDAYPNDEHIFIVLGSPVTEVGRDHDYDWAIVEPSSMRSLIQLLGRVLRHRVRSVTAPNVVILDHNLRHFEKPGDASYCRPGFEEKSGWFRLVTHDMQRLLGGLLVDGQAVIDSRPRILASDVLKPRERLSDLEHARLEKQLLPQAADKPMRRGLAASLPALNASSCWLPYASLTGLLQQRDPFRDDNIPEEYTAFHWDDGDEDLKLHYLWRAKGGGEDRWVLIEGNRLHPVAEQELRGPNISAWATTDLVGAAQEQAAAMDIPIADFALKFTVASLPKSVQGWRFHPALGFSPR